MLYLDAGRWASKSAGPGFTERRRPVVLDGRGIECDVVGRESRLANWDLTDLITCELALGEMILV